MVLNPGAVVVGRADDNDIVLSEIGVSRRHARIVVDADSVHVEDMGSGNGTLFQGTRLTRHEVNDGDEVVIDPFTLGFRVSGGDTTGEVTSGREATVIVPAAVTEPGRLEVASNHKMDRAAYEIPIGASLCLGRSEKADIVLPEPAASRLHADVGETAGSWWVRDRGSSNGTWVNGVRVREKILAANDRVRIGSVEFVFRAPSVTEAEETSDRTEAFDAVMFTSAVIEVQPPVPSPNLAAAKTRVHDVPPPPALPFAPKPNKLERPVARPAPSTLPPPPPPPPLPGPTGVELDFDVAKVKAKKGPKGRTRARPTGFFSRPINQLSFGILALAMMLIGAKIAWEIVAPFLNRETTAAAEAAPAAPAPTSAPALIAAPTQPTPASAPPTPSAPVPAPTVRAQLDPVHTQEVNALMAEGMRLFTEGKQFEAAAQFYKVQQVDPGNPDAERMGYVACEFIAVQHIFDGLQARSTTALEHTNAKAAALAAVTLALADASHMTEARRLLDAADVHLPGDPDLLAAREQLDGRKAAVARNVAARAEEKKKASLSDMFAAGQREFDRNNLTKAVSAWEAVLDADPTRASPQYYQAEAGIRSAKDKMKADSKKSYAAGLSALKANDLVTARKELAATVRIDPYNDGAATRLAEARKRLKEQASEVYKEARVLEDINQSEKAIGLYQKVLTYVDDPSDPLASKAQTRINTLLQ
jgi:pSer/pThr/pTyr-binding forkhead associated (FHA) protein